MAQATIRNQLKIMANQRKIVGNQKKILRNQDRLKLLLGTRVRIVRHGARGRIEIDFVSEEELIRIYEQLTDRG